MFIPLKERLSAKNSKKKQDTTIHFTDHTILIGDMIHLPFVEDYLFFATTSLFRTTCIAL